jgi:hypothetical protein
VIWDPVEAAGLEQAVEVVVRWLADHGHEDLARPTGGRASASTRCRSGRAPGSSSRSGRRDTDVRPIDLTKKYLSYGPQVFFGCAVPLAMNKNAALLDLATRSATAFATWTELLTTCKAGYVPTIQPKGTVALLLREQLILAGCRVFPG